MATIGTHFKSFLHWLDRRLVAVILTLMLVFFVFLALVPYILVDVPAGHIGVLWRRFGGGTVLDRVYGEGTHLILPVNNMHVYNVRLQTLNETFNVISRDGLEISIDVAMRYRVVPDMANHLHQQVGPDYVKTVLIPEIYARLSTELSQNDPVDIYSYKRIEVQNRLYTTLAKSTSVSTGQAGEEAQFLQVDDVLLRTMRLPPGLREAIVRKNQQMQFAEEYKYRLQAEEQERIRKRIEAEGIRDFQGIINQNMTPEYLAMRGIEATLKLAESDNAKIVVVGKGDGGLPLILGGFEQATKPGPRKSNVAETPAAQSPTPENPAAGKDAIQKP
jgi:Membrane protease subunits, stomatin/prohibitin homologs